MRLLAMAAVATAALLACSASEAQAQQRSERNDRAARRAEQPERRERAERGERAITAERAGGTSRRVLECPPAVTCRVVCMWTGGRREYENVRSAIVTYAPGGSGAMEVAVRTDEGQPSGMVFGVGMTCVGENVRAPGGP